MLERKDLISDDALAAPAILTKEFEKLLIMINSVSSAVKKAGDSLNVATPIKETTSAVDQLTGAEKEVIKIQNQLSTALDKQNQEYIEYKRLVNEVNKATAEKVKYGDLDTKSVNAQNSSINQLGLALQKNRQDFANLRTEEERSSKAGKELIATIQKQDKEFKDLNGTMGQHQAHVGDYANQIGKAKVAAQAVAPALSGMATALWAGTKAAAAFIATPIGLALAAIAALLAPIILFLKGTADGMDIVEEKTAGASAAMTVFKDELTGAGKAMIDAGSAFVDAAKESTVLKVALGILLIPIAAMLAPVLALGKGLLALVPDEFKQRLADAYDSGAKLANAIDTIRDAEAKYSVEEDVLLAKMQELRLESKKKILSYQEEKDKLEEVLLIEQSITDKRTQFATDELKAVSDAAGDRLQINKNDLENYREYAVGMIDAARALDNDLADSLIAALKKESEAAKGQIAQREKTINQLSALEEKQKGKGGISKTDEIVADEKYKYDLIFGVQDDFYKDAEEALRQHNAALRAIEDSSFEEVKAKDDATKEKRKADNEAAIAAEQEFQQALSNLKAQAWQTASDLSTSFFENENLKLEAQKNDLQTQMAAELEAAGNNANAKAAIESTYAKKIKDIENEQRANKRKQAIADKALAAFHIFISTAKAATEVLPNIPLSIVLASIGALQLASVLAKPIPKFAKGVENFDGGIAMVGEQGVELIKEGNNFQLSPGVPTLMNLKKGSDVIPHEETMRMLALSSLGGEVKLSNENKMLYSKLESLENTIKKYDVMIVDAIRGGQSSIVKHGSLLYDAKIKSDGSRKLIRLKSFNT